LKLKFKVNELTELKNKNRNQIEKLNENIDRLNQILSDQDVALKNIEFDKNKLQKRYDDLSFENSSNISKLKAKEENLAYTKSQLEESSKSGNKQQVQFILTNFSFK